VQIYLQLSSVNPVALAKASVVIFSAKNPLPFIIPAGDVIQRPLILNATAASPISLISVFQLS